MSSATSIERLRPERGAGGKTRNESFKPWHFFVLLSLVAATAAVLMARQPSPEHLILISIAIGAAAVCAAALYATLLPLVRKESAGAAVLSGRSRAVLEREKMLVLRSIKDLEFDRAMGKISPSDFEEMVGRLRARALSLMKQLDTETAGYRAIIERELAARVERDLPQSHACTCGTVNDADATFCKRCGKRLRLEGGRE